MATLLRVVAEQTDRRTDGLNDRPSTVTLAANEPRVDNGARICTMPVVQLHMDGALDLP